MCDNSSVQHRLGDWHLAECIHLEHTDPTLKIKLWCAITYNTRLSICRENIDWSNPFCCHYCNRKVIYDSSRMIYTHRIPMLFKMICKIFNNFSGQHSHHTCSSLNRYGTMLDYIEAADAKSKWYIAYLYGVYLLLIHLYFGTSANLFICTCDHLL